ncbi:DUF397 domain-containing protein [Actinomadura decatromicini]|uniref:DUF397 domain-containing protein n=1 Tax=Actinomadura decatromicini TaxID=2604572 RepID=A0A5D3F6B6_9ACTN|nr:DUF397 domain-containing protein [Actinomadura decatromicini]TYK44567.1 DUF397 domain-containing protein [Actinomadura decatromicini]
MAQTHPRVDLSRAQWRKSSYSNGGEGACIEVATNLPGLIAVRDSKDPDGSALTFAAVAWRRFVERLKDGRPQP